MVLLVEGDDASVLYELSRPEKSETAGRNTNLFFGVVRQQADAPPYAEYLIHRTEKGHMVRSKSELVIANMLHNMGIEYKYESRLPAGWLPDFTFIDAAGDKILWEHLGRLDDDEYVRSWKTKLDWYRKNGFKLNERLFISEEHPKKGLDSAALRKIASKIQQLL